MEAFARLAAGAGPKERESGDPREHRMCAAQVADLVAHEAAIGGVSALAQVDALISADTGSAPVVTVPPAADNQDKQPAARTPDTGPSVPIQQIGPGTRLVASDRVYVVEHVRRIPVLVTGQARAELEPWSLTLRRVTPKVRGKAARKEDKRARARSRHARQAAAARIVAREAPQVDW